MFHVLLAATLLASSPAPAATGGDTFPTIVTRDSRGGLSGNASGHGTITIRGIIIDGSSVQVCTYVRFRFKTPAVAVWTYTKWNRYCRGSDGNAGFSKVFTDPTVIQGRVCRAQRPAPGTPLDPYRCSHWKELWPR